MDNYNRPATNSEIIALASAVVIVLILFVIGVI